MRRLALLVAVAFGALVALAAPAVAHVTVASSDATPGGDAVVTFTVPTESDTASTTKLVASIPPIASVAVRPVPGWTVTTKTSKLATPLKSDEGDVTSAVSEITWTATSAASAIKPGQFGEFDISVGPLPNAASVSFPAIQYYSDGTVVKWIEKAAPGSKTEPDHPAPTLSLKAAASDASGAAGAAAPAAEKPSNAGPVALSIVALALAAAALSLAVINRAKARAT